MESKPVDKEAILNKLPDYYFSVGRCFSKDSVLEAMESYSTELRKRIAYLENHTIHCLELDNDDKRILLDAAKDQITKLQSTNEELKHTVDSFELTAKEFKSENEYLRQRLEAEWVKEKPEFIEDCILLTATFMNKNEGWLYDLFTIQKTEGYNDKDEPSWYWGIFCADGDEWGDIADLRADLYKVLPQLKTQEPE